MNPAGYAMRETRRRGPVSVIKLMEDATGVGGLLEGSDLCQLRKQKWKGSEMLRSSLTKSLAAAAIGLFAVHAATAQEAKNLPPGATAHFIYFPTAGYKLDAKDQAQIRDVAGLMQSTPDFVATILGKTDSVGSVGFNERLSQRRANAVFEALVYDNKVPENRIQMCWTGERLPFTSTADQTPEAQNRMAALS